MKNIVKTLLSVTILISLTSVTAQATVKKGKILYMKKLKAVCGMNGGEMASRHSTQEWTTLYKNGKIADEIRQVCPNVKESSLKEKFIPHYFDFFKEYSNDSGNIPSC